MDSHKGRRALIVVDVQYGFVSDATSDIPGKILKLIETITFDLIVRTQYINTSDSPLRTIVGWEKLTAPSETDFTPEIRELPAETLVKSTYAPNMDELTALLDEHDIDVTYVCGIDTDICVLMTAGRLFDCRRKVRVLGDMAGSHDGEVYHRAALTILPRLIGEDNVITDSYEHFRA